MICRFHLPGMSGINLWTDMRDAVSILVVIQVSICSTSNCTSVNTHFVEPRNFRHGQYLLLRKMRSEWNHRSGCFTDQLVRNKVEKLISSVFHEFTSLDLQICFDQTELGLWCKVLNASQILALENLVSISENPISYGTAVHTIVIAKEPCEYRQSTAALSPVYSESLRGIKCAQTSSSIDLFLLNINEPHLKFT